MNQFKELLEKQMLKAKAAIPTKPTPPPPDALAEPVETAEAKSANAEERRAAPASANVNRVTINLFDSDRRALAVIKEMLGNAGHDFTNRSDSIKVALRIAAKAKREELARVYEQVKAEDRRFKNAGQ